MSRNKDSYYITGLKSDHQQCSTSVFDMFNSF